jgi:hypothetical protein
MVSEFTLEPMMKQFSKDFKSIDVETIKGVSDAFGELGKGIALVVKGWAELIGLTTSYVFDIAEASGADWGAHGWKSLIPNFLRTDPEYEKLSPKQKIEYEKKGAISDYERMYTEEFRNTLQPKKESGTQAKINNQFHFTITPDNRGGYDVINNTPRSKNDQVSNFVEMKSRSR